MVITLEPEKSEEIMVILQDNKVLIELQCNNGDTYNIILNEEAADYVSHMLIHFSFYYRRLRENDTPF